MFFQILKEHLSGLVTKKKERKEKFLQLFHTSISFEPTPSCEVKNSLES